MKLQFLILNCITLILDCITKKYLTFSGRATRREYWLFLLFTIVVFICLSYIDYSLGTLKERDDGFVIGAFSVIFYSVLVLPLISVHIRRLHDINKSGHWWFIWMVPLIGPFWSIILSCLPGTKGGNDFGIDDKNPNIDSKKQRLKSFLVRLELLEINWLCTRPSPWICP